MLQSMTTDPTTLQPDQIAEPLARSVGRIVRSLVRESGSLSRTQTSVLAGLRDGGPRRISELAHAERVTQPSMTTLVSRLERQGLVERSQDASDGRVVNVTITATGLDALERSGAAMTATLASRIEALSAADRLALGAALPALARLALPD
jgi:DNA-binding MarR family transcriptional regulator